MEQLDLVVFDIAGTTVKATDFIPDAFKQVFAEINIELSDDQVRSIRGKSKREAISELLNQHLAAEKCRQLAKKLYDGFQRILLDGYERAEVEPIDGAEETFVWLKKRNVKIALSTGFEKTVADLLIRKIGWEKKVDTLVTNNDVSRGRPAPYLIFRAMERTDCTNVKQVAVVGDTVSDLQAGINAGVRWNVGVLSGAHSEIQLKPYRYTEIIPSVKELPALFTFLQ